MFLVAPEDGGRVWAQASDVAPAFSTRVPTPIRDVRVLLASAVRHAGVRAEELLTIRGDDGEILQTFPGGDWIEIAAEPGLGVRVGKGIWGQRALTLLPGMGRSLWFSVSNDPLSGASINTVVSPNTVASPNAVGSVNAVAANRYPGALRIHLREDGLLDVVNLVDVERYVACVVAREAWPTFHIEAFRVQAVAARTFVLYQMLQRSAHDSDVTATQGSQVYRGIRDDSTGRRATLATDYTRGIACTFTDGGKDRLFCTYYSAACGGMSQAAAIFGSEGDIEPLAGGVPCDYCKIAPGETYRWGPVSLTRKEVLDRLKSRYRNLPSLNRINRIRSIEVIERTPSGRPITLRITGSNKTRAREDSVFDILAERFRHTIGPGAMRSTDCRVRVMGRHVILDNGRGFGHGLGLCQWGAHGQALQGKTAGEILRYYFPGSKLTRVY